MISPVSQALLPPSPCGLTIHASPVEPACISARLDASMGRQDHTTSPSAPVLPEISPGLMHPNQFQQRQLAAPFVRAPDDRSRRAIRPAIPCAPDAVASIASHRAFVTCATPLVGRDGQISKGDLPDVLSEIFLREGLDIISDNQK